MKIKNLLAVCAMGCSLAILPARTYGQAPFIYYPLDETSGTNAFDHSGNGFTAITTNTSGSTGSGATWSPSSGMIGGALLFTPSPAGDVSQRFICDSPTNIISNYPFTMAGWIKTSSSVNLVLEYVFLGDGTQSFDYYAMGISQQFPAAARFLESRAGYQ